jgi:hypothetical protein
MSYFPNGLKIRLPMFLPGAITAAEMANNDLFLVSKDPLKKPIP